jgi:hypothetical protein
VVRDRTGNRVVGEGWWEKSGTENKATWLIPSREVLLKVQGLGTLTANYLLIPTTTGPRRMKLPGALGSSYLVLVHLMFYSQR